MATEQMVYLGYIRWQGACSRTRASLSANSYQSMQICLVWGFNEFRMYNSLETTFQIKSNC